MNVVWSILKVLFLLLILGSTALATPINVVVQTARPDGNPSKENLRVELWDQSSSDRIVAYTDVSGRAFFPGVEEGPWKVVYIPGNSADFVENGKFERTELLELLTMGHPKYVSVIGTICLNGISDGVRCVAGGTQNLSYVLKESSRLIKVRLGTADVPFVPLTNEYVDLEDISLDNPGMFLRTKTNMLGDVYAPLSSSVSGQYRVIANPAGYQSVDQLGVVKNDGKDELKTILVGDADAYAQIKLKDSITQLDLDVPVGQIARIDCFSEEANSNEQFSISIFAGSNDASLPIQNNAAGYRCVCALGAYQSNDVIIPGPVNAGDNINAVFNLTDPSGLVVLLLLDEATVQPITDGKFRIILFPQRDEDGNDPEGGPVSGIYEDGAMSALSVVPDQDYEVVIDALQGADGSPNDYISGHDDDVIRFSSVSNISTQQFDSHVMRLDATITVSLVDPAGNPVDGSAEIFLPPEERSRFENGNEDGESDADFTLSKSLTDGEATFRVLSGINYQVKAFPNREDDEEDSPFIVPGYITVNPKLNEILRVSRRLLRPNYTVRITPQIFDENGNQLDVTEADVIRCGVRTADDKRQSSDELTENGAIKVRTKLSRTSTGDRERLGVSCLAIFEPEGDEAGARYFGRTSIRTQPGKTKSFVVLQLGFDAEHFPPEEENFTPGEGKTFVLQDGTRLIAPPGAFGSGTEGRLYVTSPTDIEPSDSTPYFTAFDFTPYVDDQQVKETEAITICVTVTDEELADIQAEYGSSLTREDMLFASFNEESREWESTITTYNEDEVCGVVTHFSIWGTIIDIIQELQDSLPSSFKIKKKATKAGKATVSWGAPEGLAADIAVTYRIEYSTKVRTKKKCLALESFPKSKTSDTTNVKIKARRRKLCARVAYDGGTYTEPKFRKLK